MNRREAIAALTALPEALTIARAPIAPGDVILVETDRALTPEGIAHIKATLADVWPGHRVIVCEQGFRLRFVHGYHDVVRDSTGRTRERGPYDGRSYDERQMKR